MILVAVGIDYESIIITILSLNVNNEIDLEKPNDKTHSSNANESDSSINIEFDPKSSHSTNADMSTDKIPNLKYNSADHNPFIGPNMDSR